MKTKRHYFGGFRCLSDNINTVGLCCLSVLIFISSCRKWIEVSVPDSRLSTENVFSSDFTAEAAVAGIYSSFWDRGYYISVDAGLSADEFRDYSHSTALSQLYSNTLLADNQEIYNVWVALFNGVYQCNSVLHGISGSTGMSPAVKARLMGEALTWRAFYYDYLLSFWGAVPLVVTPDYKLSAISARTPVDSIISFLLNGLRMSVAGLPEDYQGGERTSIIRWANLAVQARLTARAGNWTSVDSLTSAIIGQPIFRLPLDLDSVFLKNSPEAIWQSEPQNSSQSTVEGSQFILLSLPTSVALADSFVNNFMPGDLRRNHWIGTFTDLGASYYFPFKYKDKERVDPLNEYGMVIRLAEIILLRAEARAHLGMLAAGYDDINRIRERAALTPLSGSTESGLLDAITKERENEMFSEWGDRWTYLKRTGQADGVLLPLKNGWKDSDTLYPIPKMELQSDSYLTQNPGY